MKSELSASFRSAFGSFTRRAVSQNLAEPSCSTHPPEEDGGSRPASSSATTVKQKKGKQKIRAKSLEVETETVKMLLSMGRLAELTAWSHVNMEEVEDSLVATQTTCSSNSSLSGSSSVRRCSNSLMSSDSLSPSTSCYFDAKDEARDTTTKGNLAT
uniref:Uncharacterized protein n=1 Tax=Ditylenchus dipsaci TaxID=166011 RepID=A0A915DDA5_9BILA